VQEGPVMGGGEGIKENVAGGEFKNAVFDIF
jgi:hypothetical protein